MPGNPEWEDPTGSLEPWFPVTLLLGRVMLVYMKNSLQEPHREEQIQRDSYKKKLKKIKALQLQGQSLTWLKGALHLRMLVFVSRQLVMGGISE